MDNSSGNRGEKVKEVRVSQASRDMAKPCQHEVSSLSQEYKELIAEKMELERKLQGYSKTAFLKEQQRVRNRGGNTLAAWVNRKDQMEKERRVLCDEKHAVEQRLMTIKDRVKQEQREISSLQDPSRVLFEKMLKELRMIRTLLESR